MYHYLSCGLDNIYLLNGYEVHETEDGPTYGIHNFDALHRAIALGLVNKPAPLNGKEFRFLRVELDLSQKAIADLFGYTDQTVANWEKGKTEIQVLADATIRQYYRESIGEPSELGELLKKLSDLDRRVHELQFQLEETQNGWRLRDCA